MTKGVLAKMKRIFVYGEKSAFQNYADALSACGATGVFSTNLKGGISCDGLLLPGGTDADPALYGQKNTASVGIDRQKDLDEIELVKKFAAAGLPVFGICRGLQIINIALGGTLYQDIDNAAAHKWEEHTGDKVHRITTTEGSFLRKLYGREFAVNSAHHQAIDVLAPGLTVSALAEDSTIEAVENPKKKIYAVQFHPERMAFNHRRTDTVDGRYVFEFFLGLC